MSDFEDRMKMLEQMESGRRFLPLLPVCARIDGRCFSGYTKDFERPYDERMVRIMGMVTLYLVRETNARIGYTQSDEISLVWYSDNYKSQIFFDSKIQKMNSILASLATAKFNSLVRTIFPKNRTIPPKKQRLAIFDCRVWQTPTLVEAANVFVWRELDATRNSVQMAAQHYYSHKELHKKSEKEMQEMLFAKGINWNDYPDTFKRGTYYQRTAVTRKFTCEELEKLPLKHEARNNPDLEIERAEVRRLEYLPPLNRVTNRIGVIFNGEDPIEDSSN